jgi:fatty-acid desaturase
LKQNCWTAKIWIAEELFYYAHPFLLPDFFQQKTTKYEFDVRFKVIQVFSSISIMKEFFIQEFLDSYPFILSNQQRTKIKSFLMLVFMIHRN